MRQRTSISGIITAGTGISAGAVPGTKNFLVGALCGARCRDLKVYVNCGPNADVSIIDVRQLFALGEHYNVDINGLNESSPNDYFNFYALDDKFVVYLDKSPEQ
uniref:Uncharacterized protein n=1 Tax=Ditylenchus dipsaci TaxID=166011 RepID=A0A915DYW0_9BILA